MISQLQGLFCFAHDGFPRNPDGKERLLMAFDNVNFRSC